MPPFGAPMIFFLQRLDARGFGWINQGMANPVGDWFFPCLNSAAPFVPLLVVLLAWLAFRNSRRHWIVALLVVAGVTMGDSLVFNPLKKAVARPRPAATLVGVRALASGATGGFSFPSSHTANAFLAAAILSAHFARRRRVWIASASLIGLARVYVGVHYPGDVLLSGALGWFLGQGFNGAVMGAWRRWKPHGVATPERLDGGKVVGNAFFEKGATAVMVLLLFQAVRLAWAATTLLDVPPEAARLWGMAHGGGGCLAWAARVWFTCFGDSALSLWAIPWAMQTVWLGLLAWLAWRRGGMRVLWMFIFLSALLPLTAMLSFLGSPRAALADADWSASGVTRAALFYGLLGLPVLLFAVVRFRKYPVASGWALAGFVLGTSFPWLPWWGVAWTFSGALVRLAEELGALSVRWSAPQGGAFRAGLVLLTSYGLLTSVCVYQPRFLRKLDLSLLPRNSFQYRQTGWGEYLGKVASILRNSTIREVWTDSAGSRDMVRYLLRPSFQVFSVDELPAGGHLPAREAWYLREVYLAQINPRVIFVGRRDRLPLPDHATLREAHSTEIFRQGDPIRQLQLYRIVFSPSLPR